MEQPNPFGSMNPMQMLAAGANSPELDSRAKVSRLTFKAMLDAIRNNCTCKPCASLREAADALAGDA